MDGDSSDDYANCNTVKVNMAYLYLIRYRYAFLRPFSASSAEIAGAYTKYSPLAISTNGREKIIAKIKMS